MTNKIIKGGLVTAMVLASVAIGVISLRYLSFDAIDLVSAKSAELRSSIPWRTAFYAHIGLGVIALVIGGFQFIGRLRDRFTSIHRTAGKIYVVSVFGSAVAGLAVAPFAEGGIVAKLGFAGLAVVWFYTNYRAYKAIRRGMVTQHQAWMTRNFALTFAAVTLRIWLPLFIAGLGMEFNMAYPIIAWLCWVPNLVVAEVLVRQMKRPVAVTGHPEQALA